MVFIIFGTCDREVVSFTGVGPRLRRLELERYEEIEPMELESVMTERIEAVRNKLDRDDGVGDTSDWELVEDSRLPADTAGKGVGVER
jgi:hypothetical protein